MEAHDSNSIGRSSLRNVACPSSADNNRRKPVFSDAEKFLLIEKYGEYKEILASRLSDSTSCMKKSEIWSYITQEMGLLNPNVERTPKEVRKKWDNLATTARKDFTDYRNGGGKQPPSAVTFKILELADDIVFNPQPIKDENESSSPFEPENGRIPVHVEDEMLISTEDSSLNQAISSGFRVIPTNIPETPVCPSMPKIATAGCLNFRSEKRSATTTLNNNPGASFNRLTFFEPAKMNGFRPQSDDIEAVPTTATKKRRPAEDAEVECSTTENFEETFKRKKCALELERMLLENEKLRLEVRLTTLKLEKERRLMMD